MERLKCLKSNFCLEFACFKFFVAKIGRQVWISRVPGPMGTKREVLTDVSVSQRFAEAISLLFFVMMLVCWRNYPLAGPRDEKETSSHFPRCVNKVQSKRKMPLDLSSAIVCKAIPVPQDFNPWAEMFRSSAVAAAAPLSSGEYASQQLLQGWSYRDISWKL